MVDGVTFLKKSLFEKFVSKMLCFFEKSVIAYFTSLFVIVVTRNLFGKDAPRHYLSDGQQMFKNLLNGAKVMTKLLFFFKGQFLINNTVPIFVDSMLFCHEFIANR